MALHVDKVQARRFLLSKQLLLPPYLLSGKQGVEKVFQTLRVIQFDPLNPCGRNPDLVLQSRIKNYHPDNYFYWLYKEKKGIEVYDKELCIIPLEDFSLVTHLHFKAQKHPRIKPFLKKHKNEIEKILDQIRIKGPVTTQDIKNNQKIESWWGTSATFGRVALEFLFETGRVYIVKREKGRKYYGLSHEIEKSFQNTKQYEKVEQEHILRRLSSVGILPKSGSGSGWQGVGKASEVSKIIKKLIEQKILTEVTVIHSKTMYVIHSKDKSLLQKEIPLQEPMVSFIAPLDTLMWDRNMVEDLFNFRYRWEVYTPIKKREFGYYALPILYGDTFVGRIEPVFKNGTLMIKGIWFEEGYLHDNELKKAIDTAIEKFREYVGAEKIQYSM